MAQAIPYVIQSNFVSVTLNGRPFQLLASHPTFKQMVRALRAKRWDKVPDLINVAQSISNRTHGNVEVKSGVVYYKGTAVDSSLTRMMLNLMQQGKPVGPMLKFMDYLYANPRQETIQALFDFLRLYSMPITDDGCFVAYKRVDKDYKDLHTHTVDNHVGAVPLMPRRDVDTDRSNPCSRGYHFCSRAYLSGFPGEHLMAIKIRPDDVDEVPEVAVGKGRTWRYEVIAEIPNGDYKDHDAEYFQTALITVGKDRSLLVKKLLALKPVKRLLARTERERSKYRRLRRKLGNSHPEIQESGLTKQALSKASFGRLRHWYERFAADSQDAAVLPGLSPLFGNPTRPARIAAGLSVTSVAEEVGLRASAVFKAERADDVSQEFVDKYLAAVMKLSGKRHGVTYSAAKAAAA